MIFYQTVFFVKFPKLLYDTLMNGRIYKCLSKLASQCQHSKAILSTSARHESDCPQKRKDVSCRKALNSRKCFALPITL